MRRPGGFWRAAGMRLQSRPVRRRRGTGRHQQFKPRALQRLRQLIEPVVSDARAPVFVMLNRADRDADRLGELGRRYLAMLADFAQALSWSRIDGYLSHGCTYWCSSPALPSLLRHDSPENQLDVMSSTITMIMIVSSQAPHPALTNLRALRLKLRDPHNVAGMHEEVEAVQKPSEN